MPIDASIPMSGRPVQMPAFDINKMFLTIGQLEELAARAQAVRQEAGRRQQLFAEQEAAGNLLSTLRRPPAPPPQALAEPGPGPQSGPGLPPNQPPFPSQGPVQGEAPGIPVTTPPPTGPALGGPGGPMPGQAGMGGPGPGQPGPGTPAPAQGSSLTDRMQRQASIFDDTVIADLYRVAPHAAPSLIESNQKLAIQNLEYKQKLFDNVARHLNLVDDQASYDAWRKSYATQLDDDIVQRIPVVYSPDIKEKMAQTTMSISDSLKMQVEQAKVKNDADRVRVSERQVGVQETEREQAERRRQVVQTPTGAITVTELEPRGGGTGVQGYGGPGPQPGVSAPIPGTQPRMGGGEAAAAGTRDMATNAHLIAKDFEQRGEVGSLWEHAPQAAGGLGRLATPPSKLRYNNAQEQFVDAARQVDPGATREKYFVQPGEISGATRRGGHALTPTDQQLIQQKQQARQAVINKLQDLTNQPQGLTPPGRQRAPTPTPQANIAPGAPGSGPTYTRQTVREYAAKKGMTEAAVEKLILQDLHGRIVD